MTPKSEDNLKFKGNPKDEYDLKKRKSSKMNMIQEETRQPKNVYDPKK